MSLDRTTGGHEVLQNGSSCWFTKVLIVAIATKLSVFRHQDVLPRQDNLVVVGEPSCVEVGAPIVDFELGVAHAQDGQILLDGGGSGRSVRKNCHVDFVSEGGMEVPFVAGFRAISKTSVETDVVGGSVHPSVPRCERDGGFLLALQGDCRARGHEVSLAAVSHVGDFHVEDVVAGKHTVGRLEVP